MRARIHQEMSKFPNEIWLELQRELAARSPRAEQIIAKQSGHFIQNDEPQLVAAGVRRMLDTQ
jgi:pimeloyl-ACP methyl ester carboxylesterase